MHFDRKSCVSKYFALRPKKSCTSTQHLRLKVSLRLIHFGKGKVSKCMPAAQNTVSEKDLSPSFSYKDFISIIWTVLHISGTIKRFVIVSVKLNSITFCRWMACCKELRLDKTFKRRYQKWHRERIERAMRRSQREQDKIYGPSIEMVPCCWKECY